MMTPRRRGKEADSGQHPAAVGYARVSTDEQAREGVSLDAQRARIEAYAEAKGLKLLEVLTDDLLAWFGERPERLSGAQRELSPEIEEMLRRGGYLREDDD